MWALLKKLKLYKNIFIIFMLLSTASTFIGLTYFTIQIFAKNEIRSKIYKSYKSMDEARFLSEKYFQLVEQIQNKPKTEKQRFLLWNTVLTFNEGLAQSSLPLTPLNYESIKSINLNHQMQVLHDFKETQISIAKTESLKLLDLDHWLIYTGIATLFFGFIFPFVIFVLMGRLANKGQKMVYKEIKSSVQQWNTTYNQYDKPFKHIEFWLEIVLISSEKLLPMSKNVFALWLAEIAELVRQEIRKEAKASADNSDPTGKTNNSTGTSKNAPGNNQDSDNDNSADTETSSKSSFRNIR
ncbi:MAG: hypothetical protein HOO06_04560 [Bdellovibrionaceae bacterium]|jgi:hypothetical protein|nr:hypothetical protein [Pseudobdellovibrionaceae bacterium]